MSRIPESFYFYQDQLRKVREEKIQLQKQYESKIDGLNSEISFLKEQIEAQHTMIAQSIEHVMNLEKQIKVFDLELSAGKNTEKK
jgi:TolA-binding protein